MSTSDAGALGGAGAGAGEPRPPPDGTDAAARTDRLGCSLSRDVSEDALEDPCSHSSTPRADAEDVFLQVTGRTGAVTGSAAGGRPPAGSDGAAFLSNGDVSPREREELRVTPSGSQLRTATASLDRYRHPHCPGPPGTAMLSSSVVTVLAPHRGGRLRRVKRSEENGSLGARDGTSGATNFTREPFKEAVDRSLSVGPRGQIRTPFSGTRQNTVGCRTNVDYETRRKMTQTASLDVNLARMDTRAATSPLSPLSLHPPGQRAAPHAGLPGGPPLSLKPTSSSLLLSLRRSNCNGRSANAAPTPPGKTLVPQRTQDRHGQASKHAETGPVRVPSSSNPDGTAPFKARGPFPPQARAQISADSSPRRVPYDHFPLPQPVPRRTALTSTSWWKQVSQDSGCPPATGDAFKVKSDFSSPSVTDIGWFDNQVHSNRNINVTTPALGGCVKTQGGTRSLTQTNTEASANHKSELPLRQKYESSLDMKEPLKSHSLPGVSHGSKISRAAAASVAESRPSVLNPTSVPGRFANCWQARTSHHTVPTSNREASSGLPPTSDSSTAPSHSSQTPKAFNGSPLGFDRSYTSIPVHPKPASTLIPAGGACARPNYSPVATAPAPSPPAPDDHSGLAAARGPSPLPPPALPPTPIGSLLTPPATPVISSPNYSGSLSPNAGRTLSSSLEKDSKNKSPGAEGKKARRVTWEDSVDLQQSQKARAERPEQVPPDAPPSRPSAGIKAPSIFNLLRSGNPAADAFPICSRTPKVSSILVGKAGRYRSLSSDAADLASRGKETFGLTPSDCVVSNQGRHALTASRHERTLSLESGTAQSACSGSLALPPERSYQHRYSSPPYTALMSTRKEAKVLMPGSLLHHQPLQPSYGRLSTHADPPGLSALPVSKPLQSPIGPPQPRPSPFQTKAIAVDGRGASPEGPDNNDRDRSKYPQNGQMVAVVNRVQVSPRGHGSPSPFITETLVYSIRPKADAAPKVTQKPGGRPANPPASQETQLSPGAALGQGNRAAEPSDQNGDSLTEPQNPEDEKRGSREGILGKSSRFFSMESSNEQIQKRGRFALKRSTSTPNSNLSGSDSDRSSKTNNKMDQMVNRLKKTFSTRRSEDDLSFPWKWRRTSQTPSVTGTGEVDGVGTPDRPKAAELPSKGQEPATGHGWTQNRCSLTPPCESTKAGGEFCVWSGTPSPNGDTGDSSCVEQMCVKQPHGPPTHQFDQFLSTSEAFPAHAGKSTPSPRSPFSPFSSLSPVSSIPSSDVTDDVFYSPKLPRRREPASPCEPGEGFSLAGLRRSRPSTGPPSVSPSLELDYSSCADLKYGIEPGRSYSVSSVLSSRPSGPGRISTGSRVMSVGNLCESALTYAGKSQDLDLACDGPDWAACRASEGLHLCRGHDPSKIRSRSLPRSLTRCFSSWNSGLPAPPRGDTLNVQPAHLVGPDISASHFTWDAGGPPTPPPTPPPSPVSRRMSKPPSPSSPIFPMSPVSPQQLDGPSRGQISRLDTFEEFSDNSSETTTDDEYYLETREEEKETEL